VVDHTHWTARLSRFVVDRPKLCMTLLMLLVAGFSPGILKFAEKYDVRIWFLETDPNIQTLNRFERQFGNDENMVVALHSPSGLLNPEKAEILDIITEKLWTVPQVQRVDSLTNYNITRADGDEIIVEPFFEGFQEWSEETYRLRLNEALNHPVIPGYLISEGGKSAMIFARLTPTLEGSPDYQQIVQRTREIVAPFEGVDGLEIHLIGEATVNDAFREVSNNDGALILPIMIALILLYLAFVFHSWKAVILPMIVVIFSTTTTLGIGFMVGYTYNQILSILPAILIAISIADSVHIIVSYFQYLGKGQSNKEAAYLALQKNMIPTLLTTLSTTIGFLSLAATDLMPVRELGILSSIGCTMAWLITIFLIGPLLSMIHFKAPAHFQKMKEIKNSSPIADRYIAWVKKYQGSILVCFSLVILVSIYLTSLIRVNSNPYDYFTDDIPVRQANKFIEEHFGGNSGPELLISSGVVDGIKDPHFLKKVEQLKNWLDDLPYVNKTLDIIDIVKDVNQNLNQGNKEFYRLPETQEEVAQQLFFYSLGLPQGMDLNNQMSLDYESMRMTVLWNINDTRGWLKHVAEIEEKAQELGLNLEPTGKFLLFQRMMDYVVITFFQSVLMALFLVAILMSILFRSVKLGLLSLLPNIIPLFIGAGFMYLAGIDLNIGSAIVASVCLGIAIDDTIHFLSHYYRLRKEGLAIEESMSQIMTYTGSALIFTTLILVSCFGLYLLGDFIPSVNFGVLCAVVLTMAIFIDLMFLPALLMKIDQKKT